MVREAPSRREDTSMRRASFFLIFLCACAGKGPIPGGDKPAWVSTPNGDLRFPADRFVAAVGSVQVAPKATASELLASVDAAARAAVMSSLGPVAAGLGLPAGIEIAGRWRQGDTAYAWGVFDKAKALATQQANVASAEKAAQDLLAQGAAEEGDR